jgi:hypothetical protein
MTNLQALALAAIEHLRQGIADPREPRFVNIGTAKAPKWQPVKDHFGQARLNASHVATKCPTTEARAWMLRINAVAYARCWRDLSQASQRQLLASLAPPTLDTSHVALTRAKRKARREAAKARHEAMFSPAFAYL